MHTNIYRALSFFHYLGGSTLKFLQELGGLCVFFLYGMVLIFSFPLQLRKFVDQIYFIGVKSVFVILLVGLFAGMVLGLQSYYSLVKYGSEGVLGGVVALSVIRELGPVLTAIMVIGRAGSAMAAEIGIMRITEQIDALYTMAINPIRYLLSPRIAASVVCFPLLTALFDVVAIFGGYVVGVIMLDINSGIFMGRLEDWVLIKDVLGGFYKSIAFGLTIVTICCYQGFFVHKRQEGFGAKGVSFATTSAVVLSCVCVLIADYILTSFLL